MIYKLLLIRVLIPTTAAGWGMRRLGDWRWCPHSSPSRVIATVGVFTSTLHCLPPDDVVTCIGRPREVFQNALAVDFALETVIHLGVSGRRATKGIYMKGSESCSLPKNH